MHVPLHLAVTLTPEARLGPKVVRLVSLVAEPRLLVDPNAIGC